MQPWREMSYLRAFSSLGCPQATLDEALALAARFSLDAVELRSLGGTVELPAYLAAQFGSPEDLADRLAAGVPGIPRVRLAALGTSFRLVGAGPLDRDALIDFAGWAEALGVRWLRVFDGGKLADAAELAAASEAVRWWREERARHGWKTDIMVETHDSLFTAEAMGRAVEAMPGLAILWDSHHTWKKGGEDPLHTWAQMRAHVVHVHLKDSISVPSSRHPYTYVLPGTGEFPAAALVPVLREQFDGVVSLEWEKLWHPNLPPLEDALAAAAERAWW